MDNLHDSVSDYKKLYVRLYPKMQYKALDLKSYLKCQLPT
jgi:hypothetical protein